MKRIVMSLVAAALVAVSVAVLAQATVRERFQFEDRWSSRRTAASRFR